MKSRRIWVREGVQEDHLSSLGPAPELSYHRGSKKEERERASEMVTQRTYEPPRSWGDVKVAVCLDHKHLLSHLQTILLIFCVHDF